MQRFRLVFLSRLGSLGKRILTILARSLDQFPLVASSCIQHARWLHRVPSDGCSLSSAKFNSLVSVNKEANVGARTYSERESQSSSERWAEFVIVRRRGASRKRKEGRGVHGRVIRYRIE